MTAAHDINPRAPSNFGIGASEIAAVVGLNPYASPWDVWLYKTGQVDRDPTNGPMEWGHRLEPAIRQKYVDMTESTVWAPPQSLYDEQVTWARATPDGIVVSSGIANRKNWQSLLQCKNVGTWVEKAWSAAPPIYVQLQEQWEMRVTGLDRADVAVLIGGNDYRCYTVHRDDKMIGDLLTIADDFWHKVESRTQPIVDDSDACKEHFEKKYTKASNIEMVADEECESLFVEWQRLHLEEKRIEKEAKRIRNLVRERLAEAQADRIKSSIGTAVLQRSGGKPTVETDWKVIAELLGSTKCTPEEFAELVTASTTAGTTAEKVTLYAPRTWAKESV